MSKKVIFVDDSNTVLLSAEASMKSIENTGAIICKYCNNPLDAMKFIKEDGFDLIITDINMPEMNGLDMVSEIRSVGIKTPAIALTTENKPEMKAKGKAIGLTGWLAKPFSSATLQMAVKRVLRLR